MTCKKQFLIKVRKFNDGFYFVSSKGNKISRPFSTEKEANFRLKNVRGITAQMCNLVK